MEYFDAECNAKVTITCGGVPLEGPYMPPPSSIAELGRYLASKYAAKDAQPWTTTQTDTEVGAVL